MVSQLAVNRRGFTLIEVIVVAAIIAILAGILVPMIFNQIDEAKVTKAKGECDSISKAIQLFRKDTGVWPNKSNTTTSDVTLLAGLGNNHDAAILAALGFNTTKKQNYVDHLRIDDNAAYGALWKGPYLTAVDADPWGNQYITNSVNFNDVPAVPVWVISAGPNGTMETSAIGEALGGDDIGVRIK